MVSHHSSHWGHIIPTYRAGCCFASSGLSASAGEGRVFVFLHQLSHTSCTGWTALRTPECPDILKAGLSHWQLFKVVQVSAFSLPCGVVLCMGRGPRNKKTHFLLPAKDITLCRNRIPWDRRQGPDEGRGYVTRMVCSDTCGCGDPGGGFRSPERFRGVLKGRHYIFQIHFVVFLF